MKRYDVVAYATGGGGGRPAWDLITTDHYPLADFVARTAHVGYQARGGGVGIVVIDNTLPRVGGGFGLAVLRIE